MQASDCHSRSSVPTLDLNHHQICALKHPSPFQPTLIIALSNWLHALPHSCHLGAYSHCWIVHQHSRRLIAVLLTSYYQSSAHGLDKILGVASLLCSLPAISSLVGLGIYASLNVGLKQTCWIVVKADRVDLYGPLAAVYGYCL